MEVNTQLQLLLLLILVLINFNLKIGLCNAQESNGRLIFEENFNSNELDASLWSREIKIPLEPDYEFCVYHKHDDTIQINNGVLRLKPSLFEDLYGEDSVSLGQLRLADCTSSIPQECQQQAASYNILPPVISAKLVTKNHFEFRYGVVEIRAKFPEGDWLYPQMWLEPLYKSYDPRFANARVDLGRARGNAVLLPVGNPFKELGGKLLEFGLGNGSAIDFQENLVRKTRVSTPWTRDFHTYKTTWTSRGFTFHVDGELVGRLWPTEGGWSSDDSVTIDERVSPSMVPFDEKFYLSIGLGVGGIRVFPDGTQTNAYPKPWRNISAKAMLLFWQSRDKWLKTWHRGKGNNTALEIDYVRVWALDQD